MKKFVHSTITILLLAIICATIACKKPTETTNENEAFTTEATEYGVHNISGQVIVLETNQTQIVYDDKSTFFTIQNYDQSKCFEAYLGTTISSAKVKDVLNVSISTKGLVGLPLYQSTKMEVTKKEGNKMWLWESELAIGIIIKING